MLAVLAALLLPLGMQASDFDLSGYTLVKSMDFSGFESETQLTKGETATEKAWDNGNGLNQTMYHVTDEAYAGYMIFQSFTSKGFIISANGGLYSKSAQRCAAVTGLTKGQLVVFTTTQNADNVMSFYKTHAKGNNLPDGNYNLTKFTDGNGYYAVMTDDGYLGFNGLNGKQAIAKIDIYQPKEGTNLATYTVKYVDDSGNELQEAKTYTSAIGMECNVYPADRPGQLAVGETTYVLNSNDAAEKTVAADGSTVVTLTYKAAVPVPYSVVEKSGDIIFRTTSGNAVTGSSIKLPYRFYNAANGQLYKKSQTSKEFNYTFTLTQENQTENLEYTAVEGINNVVFITEGEDVAGLTACTTSNTGIRSSNSASAFAAEDTKIVTLGPGTYKLHAVIYDASKSPDSHWIFKAGDRQIADLNCTTVNIQELESEEFTLTEPADIIMAAAGSAAMGLDALYIVGDGEVQSVEEEGLLKNADFSKSTPINAEYIYGYGKDGAPYGLQDVEGWTTVVVNGDNGNADFPNSGMGAGVVAYGSATALKGNNMAAPAAGPNGEAGNCLGFFAVWGCGGYYAQDVTLAPGDYTITVPIYNQSGTQANTSYVGFFPEGSETGYTVAVNPEAGAWAIETVKFSLTKETAGQIRLGYQSTGSGSGANPMIFIDGIKIDFAESDVLSIAKAELQAEIEVAEALLATEGYTNERQNLIAVIEIAKYTIENVNDVEVVNDGIEALKKVESDFIKANTFAYQKYIVQNVASGKFWAAGNSWGTQASLVDHPEYLKLAVQPDGKYFIESQVNNGGTQYYFNGDYMDNGSPVSLTIKKTAEPIGYKDKDKTIPVYGYTIANGDNYYGWDGTSTVLGKNLDMSSADGQAMAIWMITSLDDAKANMVNATADDPVDATFLIEDHDFGRNNRYSNRWEVTSETADGKTNFNISGGNNTNNCAESYHAKFSLSQTLTGIPAGVYELTAQGFYRADEVEGMETADLPVFFANGETATFPVKDGEEGSMSDASVSFAEGKYAIEPIRVVVGEDGQLTIGARLEQSQNLWCIFDNFVLTYYGEEEVAPQVLEQIVNFERYPGMGYGVTVGEADLEAAKNWLGVDELTTSMLRIENADGELISDYAPFDGWFNGEGIAEKWGSNTKVCVKFFQAIPNGKFEICDMNGADEVGKTYTVKWQLVNGEKSVRYTINVNFVEKPVLDLKFADLTQKGDDMVVSFTSELGKCYESFSADVDVAGILATLEAASLADVDIYAVQSDGTLDDNYKLNTTDGWRNAAGDWQGWGADAYFYVKADFGSESNQIYEVGGMENNTNEPATYTATYAFVKKGTTDAVVLKVNLIYPSAFEPTAFVVEFTDAGYATFYDSQLNYMMPNGLEAYVVTGATTSSLSYAKIEDVIPAGCAVILKTVDGEAGKYMLVSTEKADAYTGTNLLKGSDEATTTYADAADGYLFYKLAYGHSGTRKANTLGWYWGAGGGAAFDIEGHHAWLAIPQSIASARGYNLAGDVTSINAVDMDGQLKGDLYNLRGQRVSSPAKGVYILNNKKVIVK